MATIRLPGLVDAHVHLREPGYEYKEDFYSGTAAALAGGVTTVLDMPNTRPPTATPDALIDKARRAAAKAVCDVGLFVGATNTHLDAYLPVAERACGLKIYVSDTFGSLRIEELRLLDRFFRTWAEKATRLTQDVNAASTSRTRLGPIAVHAENLMLPACLALCHLYDTPLHVVHVSRRSEIELIRRAKEQGYPVTCEVTPHHLFLSTDDLPRLGARGDMRPRLATPDDVAALWENLHVVDVFATDHAPHTLAEKGASGSKDVGRELAEPAASPPPGVPGVETLLPLLLTAVHEGRLEVDDIVARCVVNPRRIYHLPAQPDTWTEVDVDASFVLRDEDMHTKAGWTPFAGKTVFGRVERVFLRGQLAFDGMAILARPGSGRVLFQAES
jgi:carbamoyl-phosphate synthase/aspartate carbamoyltransferase/dihydroorotase